MDQETDGGATGRRAKPKKESSLTMRMTRETRAKLEAFAEKEGRSVSEMAERWIDQAADGHARLEELLGGVQVADAIKAMVRLTRDVEQHYGAPVSESQMARVSLGAGWGEIIRRAIPLIPADQLFQGAARLRVETLEALRSVERSLRHADMRGELLRPGYRAARATLPPNPISATLAELARDHEPANDATPVDVARLWTAFRDCIDGPDALMNSLHRSQLLDALRDARDFVAPELRETVISGLQALATYEDAEREQRERYLDAVRIGRDLAGAYAANLGEVMREEKLPPALRPSQLPPFR